MQTNVDEKTYSITPLGAAVVEAMPDRKKMSRIQSRFKKTGDCPVSELFPTKKDVIDFYDQLSENVEETE